MKSFTVESILGVRHETTISAPDRAPVQHDVINRQHSSSDDAAATQRQQLNTDPGSLTSLNPVTSLLSYGLFTGSK